MTPWLLAVAGPVTEPPFVAPGTGLLLGLLLVLLNGFFVAAEFALVKVRPTQLDAEVLEGRSGRLARHMLGHLDAYLSASQLGITLSSLALGWVGEPAFSWIVQPVVSKLPGASPELVHSASLILAFTVITGLHIVIGEQAPKAFAIRRPLPTALWIAWPLHGFYKLTYPLIWLLNRASIGLLSMLGLRAANEGEGEHSEDELRLLLATSRGGNIPELKRDLLDNVFELSHRVARQIMVPRADVVYLSNTKSADENLRLARMTGHTRFPLCDGDLDKVVGLIHIKDLFRTTTPLVSLKDVAREISFVPESLTLDRLLKRMRSERMHLAAVLDEYGGVSGIVTLENVIEEIVGPIQDEFDTEKPELVRKGENTYQVSGAMLVADLEDELRLDFSDRDEDTIGGVALSELGQRPRVGDQVNVGPLVLEVLEVERNRIKTLRVTVTPAVAAATEESSQPPSR
ncbi:MAG: hemolysin family protein [Acidobacteriota bacterium]